jgi:hypothetical protein
MNSKGIFWGYDSQSFRVLAGVRFQLSNVLLGLGSDFVNGLGNVIAPPPRWFPSFLLTWSKAEGINGPLSYAIGATESRSLRDSGIRAPIHVPTASYIRSAQGLRSESGRHPPCSAISDQPAGRDLCRVPIRISSRIDSMVATWEAPGYESTLKCRRHLSAARDTGNSQLLCGTGLAASRHRCRHCE